MGSPTEVAHFGTAQKVHGQVSKFSPRRALIAGHPGSLLGSVLELTSCPEGAPNVETVFRCTFVTRVQRRMVVTTHSDPIIFSKTS